MKKIASCPPKGDLKNVQSGPLPLRCRVHYLLVAVRAVFCCCISFYAPCLSSAMDQVPDCVLVSILQHLEGPHLVKSEAVCVRWRRLVLAHCWHLCHLCSQEPCPLCRRPFLPERPEHFSNTLCFLASRCHIQDIGVEGMRLDINSLGCLENSLKCLRVVRCTTLCTVDELSRCLERLSACLEQLELNNCSLSAAPDCPRLSWNGRECVSNLRVLCLVQVHVCPDVLCDTLPRMPLLCRLWLDVTCFRKPCRADSLAVALSSLTSLQCFLFQNNFPNYRICPRVLGALAGCTRMQRLQLAGCGFGDDDFERLVSELPLLTTLSVLACPSLTDGAVARVSTRLRMADRQLTLYLCGTDATTRSAPGISFLAGFPSAITELIWNSA